jgi:hypothetical protein
LKHIRNNGLETQSVYFEVEGLVVMQSALENLRENVQGAGQKKPKLDHMVSKPSKVKREREDLEEVCRGPKTRESRLKVNAE